ncbi:MAG TPA: hypothetical protein PKA77_00845 [Chitinophagaceae bacterium]|jgi:hypothetical protein|nr:hypothetical protein [Chitinophagaceae bacterium]HMU56970.1 hypothetical protein [Chitinophagaceae bacterium]
MKAATLFLAIFFTSAGFSQADSLLSKSTSQENLLPKGQLVVIKGEDIKNFPSYNIMEVLNGYFPWVFGNYPDANDFLFVIDGFLLRDINSISVNDIEEIAFSPTLLNGELASYSKPGIFYIKTNKAYTNKVQVNFSTQAGVGWSKSKFVPGENITASLEDNKWSEAHNNTPRVFNSNYLSLLLSGKKWGFSASGNVAFLKKPLLSRSFDYGPDVLYTYNKLSEEAGAKGDKSNLVINFRYKSEKLEGGISGGYSHYGLSFDTASLIDNSKGKKTYNNFSEVFSDYYYCGAYVRWVPVRKLQQELRFEYSKDNFAENYNSVNYEEAFSGYRSTVSGLVKVSADHERVLLRSMTSYSLVDRNNIKTVIFLNASWGKPTYNYGRYSETLVSGVVPPAGIYYYNARGEQKVGTLNPSIDFSYKNFLSVNGGMTFLIGKKEFGRIVNKDKIFYYAALETNLKSLFRIKGENINTVKLLSQYYDMAKNNDTKTNIICSNRLLFPVASPTLAYYHNEASYYIPSDTKFHVLKNKMLSIGVYTKFKKPDIVAAIEWSMLKTKRFEELRVSFGSGYMYYIVPVDQKTKAFSFFLTLKALATKNVEWNIATNILLPHRQESWNYYGTPEEIPWKGSQISLQNKVGFRKFIFQVNALIELNHEHRKDFFGTYPYQYGIEKTNQFILSNFLVGYEPGFTAGKIKKMSLFVQAKNIVMSQKMVSYYDLYSYAGAGINITF